MFLHGAHGPLGIALVVVFIGMRILMRRGGGPFGGMRGGRGGRGRFF